MYNYNELIQKDKKFIWHPFTQMKLWNEEEQLIIERGEGNKLYDVNGNGYIDAYGSLWCNVHGHNIPEINEAIINQLNKVAHTTLLGSSNIPSIILAEKLVEISPSGLNKVFYSDDGATSVEIGLKMAYQYWKLVEGKERNKFLTFENSYHGDTIGSVSLGGIELFHDIFKGLLFETISVPQTYSYRMGENVTLKEAGELVLNQIESVLKTNQGEIAALVMEPRVFGAAGMIVQPDGFVKQIRNLTEKYDTLLICDEVATGFGRTGEMFACTAEEICPDIMTVAKGITAGYLPVAATLTKDKIYNAFLGEYTDYKTFYHGHTYTGNQLGCAASIANIDLMKKNKTIENVKKVSKYFDEKLTKLFNSSSFIGEIRQRGVMIGIEIVKNKETKQSYDPGLMIGHNIIMECRNFGVLTRNLGDVIILNPPLSITTDEIDIIVGALEKSIDIVIRKF